MKKTKWSGVWCWERCTKQFLRHSPAGSQAFKTVEKDIHTNSLVTFP